MADDQTMPPPPPPPPPPSPPQYPAARSAAPVKVILAVIVVIVLLGIGSCVMFWRTVSGPATAADAFLKTLATKGPDAAWNMASPAFRQTVPEDQWEASVRQTDLMHYQSSSWNDRGFDNNIGHVQGTITTTTGATLPMRIELVNTGGTWQVQNLHLRPAGWASPAVEVAPGRIGTISAGKLATVCQDNLTRQTGLAVTDVTCPDVLLIAPGATQRCTGMVGGARVPIDARVDSVDPVTKAADVKCSIDARPN